MYGLPGDTGIRRRAAQSEYASVFVFSPVIRQGVLRRSLACSSPASSTGAIGETSAMAGWSKESTAISILRLRARVSRPCSGSPVGPSRSWWILGAAAAPGTVSSALTGLTVGRDGALYQSGAIGWGAIAGGNDAGVVYRVALDGSWSTVVSFPSVFGPLGNTAFTSLTLGSDGRSTVRAATSASTAATCCSPWTQLAQSAQYLYDYDPADRGMRRMATGRAGGCSRCRRPPATTSPFWASPPGRTPGWGAA